MFRTSLMVAFFAGTTVLALAQQQTGILQVRGFDGEAGVIRVDGRPFVDLEALVRITGATVSFEGGSAVLTLPPAVPDAGTPASNGFSRAFLSAAIEALASMREWGGPLVVAIKNGLPVGNSIRPYRGRAADKVRLATAAASTDDDRKAANLLQQEFSNVDAWSNKLVNARNSMSAANLTLSEDALQQDPMFQGIVRCGEGLAEMLGGGSFQEVPACR